MSGAMNGTCHTCHTCHKPATYDLRLAAPVHCWWCKESLVPEDTRILLCSTQCRGPCWPFESFSATGDDVVADVVMEDVECGHCGRRNDPVGEFRGQWLKAAGA